MKSNKKIALFQYRLKMRSKLQEIDNDMLKVTREELDREWQRRYNNVTKK